MIQWFKRNHQTFKKYKGVRENVCSSVDLSLCIQFPCTSGSTIQQMKKILQPEGRRKVRKAKSVDRDQNKMEKNNNVDSLENINKHLLNIPVPTHVDKQIMNPNGAKRDEKG